MSFIYEKPLETRSQKFIGGVASLADIMAAAWEQGVLADNLTASAAAMERAIDDRNTEVFQTTGVKLDNPYRTKLQAGMQEAAMQEQRRLSGRATAAEDPAIVIRNGVQKWQQDVATAAARIPDGNVGDRLNRSIEADAMRITGAAERKADQLNSSRPGLGKYIAMFAGGGAAIVRDPLQMATMLLGGGPGAGRTVVSRVLTTALKEAAINGATEAAMQPVVQAWREKAGLDHGLDQAMRNVAFATLFGGVLGAGGQAVGEVAGRLTGRAMDAATEAAVAEPRVKPQTKAALAGDTKAARTMLSEIRDALPADARGALDHAEVLDHAETLRPAGIDPETHDRAIAAAHRIEAYEPAKMPVNERMVERITDQLLPPMEGAAGTARPKSLVEFLKAEGGVLDQAGELKAIGAEALAKKSGKRGQPDRRVALDHARERAEQAGYIGRPGETQTTTVADLLDAIDRDLRGDKVYSRADDAAPPPGFDAERQRVRDRVAELTEIVGPGTDENLLRKATELSLREDIDVADAFERVVMDSAPNAGRDVAAEDIPPGWSDAELEAASSARGAEPDGHMATPFDDPTNIDPEFEISARDLADYGDVELAGDDGPMTLAAMMDDIKQDSGMAALVRACRTGD